jgi:hypothetical protein
MSTPSLQEKRAGHILQWTHHASLQTFQSANFIAFHFYTFNFQSSIFNRYHSFLELFLKRLTEKRHE